MYQGLVFVMSGPTAVGKTSIAQHIIRVESRIQRVVTTTTRPPRNGEVDGQDYHFVSDSAFKDLIRRNALLEHADVYGFHYGSTYQELARIADSKRVPFMIIDVQGMQSLLPILPNMVSYFILPENLNILEKRVRKRGDSEEVLTRRMKTAHLELGRAGLFTYRFVNPEGKLKETTERILERMRFHIQEHKF